MRPRARAFFSAFLLSLVSPSTAVGQAAPPDTSLLARSGVVFPERHFVAVRSEAGWAEVERMMDAFDWNGPGA